MKLSWKLFFLTTPVFILFLTLFGTWTLQEGFDHNLDQEIRRCIMENQMFQNSYEMTRHGLSEEQLAKVSTEKLVEGFYKRDSRNTVGMRILDKDGSVLYQDTGIRLEHSVMEKLTAENNVGYELVEAHGGKYLVVMCITAFEQYIETTSNITQLFRERSDSYARYQFGLLVVSLLAGCLILIVIFAVMRHVRTLSGAVRKFAGGQYDVRVALKSKDEIGALAKDFNWMADAMAQQMERLQSEVERQEEFTSAFAHELKTPLTSIIGYADTIRQMELSPEETDMCADYIYRQGKRLQSLSYKLLEMAMVGKEEIDRKRIAAEDLIRDIADTVSPVLKEKDITLELQAQEGVLYGDRDLLSTVFINFLDNARKASEKGSRIRLTGRKDADGYVITVEDEGIGIPEEELTRITEAFYMVDKSRARKEGGAGLGLALCRKILYLHRALWKIESAPGKGTKITVSFHMADQGKRERRKRRDRDGR